MKTYYPSYYKDFVCLASACPDTCCAGWELPVDEKSISYYGSLSAPFSKKITSSIVKDADGDDVFCLKDGRCPFLDCDNLCEIRKQLGWEHTPDVCRQHPDFIEEYDDFTEITPSLSCPAAVKLILSPSASYPVHTTESTDEWLKFLCVTRNRLFSLNRNGFIKYCTGAVNLVYKAENEFAEEYDSDDIPFETNEEDFVFSEDEFIDYFREITGLFMRLEILTDGWKNLLQKVSSAEDKDIVSSLVNVSAEDTAVFDYLIFRYFLKAVNGYPASALIRLMAYSVCTLRAYSLISEIPFSEIARLASKETEHNPDNISAFAEYFL